MRGEDERWICWNSISVRYMRRGDRSGERRREVGVVRGEEEKW